MKKATKGTSKILIASVISIVLAGTAFAYESRSANRHLIEKRDAVIASSFDVDLSGYRKLNPPEKEYFSKGLLAARKQANVQAGDTIPITYLSADETTAYLIKQDAYGINFLYAFDRAGEDWTLVYHEQTQGIIMPPGDQAESIRLRNAEGEKEIISASGF